MTTTMTTDDGRHRARILQGTRTRLGPVLVGVESVAEVEPAGLSGGRGLRARLLLSVPEGDERVELVADDEVDLGPHGVLHLPRMTPAAPGAGGPETAVADRAVVYLELRPGG